MKFPFQQQLNEMDCGPTCLYMISKFHGRNLDIEKLKINSELGKEGVNLFGISNAAENIGLKMRQPYFLILLPTFSCMAESLHWRKYVGRLKCIGRLLPYNLKS